MYDAPVFPPDPPAHLIGGVGPGAFWQTGRDTLALMQQAGAIGTHERVLDAGCGLGRLAWPLAQLLDERSEYDGFDTSLPYVEWCRTGLGLDPARFRFHHFEIYSSMYNPVAPVRAEEFVFPWRDGAFTFAIATSLFTHLSEPAAVQYLNEFARVLERGGRAYISCFVLDDESRATMATRPTHPEFTTKTGHGMVANPDSPEDAVAFEIDWLHRVFLGAGFEIAGWIPGIWRHVASTTYQDVVIARKA